MRNVLKFFIFFMFGVTCLCGHAVNAQAQAQEGKAEKSSRLENLDELFTRNEAVEAYLQNCDPERKSVEGSNFLINSKAVENFLAREISNVNNISKEDALRAVYRKSYMIQKQAGRYYAFKGCTQDRVLAAKSHIKKFGFANFHTVMRYLRKL